MVGDRLPVVDHGRTRPAAKDARLQLRGRPAGATTAAQFLQRFVKEGTPWIHHDIAGVALLSEATALAPKGATGWFVRSLDRLVREGYEG